MENAPSHKDAHLNIASRLGAIESILMAHDLTTAKELKKLQLITQAALEQLLEARSRQD